MILSVNLLLPAAATKLLTFLVTQVVHWPAAHWLDQFADGYVIAAMAIVCFLSMVELLTEAILFTRDRYHAIASPRKPPAADTPPEP